MVITSYGFLLVFLPLTIFIYWRISYKLSFLCIVSYIFYAMGGLVFIPLLLGLSLITYWLALRNQGGLGIGLNLLALAFFKYWNFGTDTLNAIGQSLGMTFLLPLLNLALPLGISFFVFKHIGYLLDIRAGRYPPTTNRLLFVTYSAFFPQISAGPMSVSDDTLKQLANLPQQIEVEQIYQALVSISVGLVKKVIIADMLSATLQTGLLAPDGGGGGMVWGWAAVIIYALQLYFDFSSYTDIVLGVGMLFGVTLPANFNNPYLAVSPADFWSRWHISLSTWFRFYLFSPLSRNLLKRWGTKRSEAAQYSANILTMGLIGLWHGASWAFILWGLYHGLLLNIYAWAKRRKIEIEGRALLIVFVLIGWALFLSPSLEFATHLLSNMFGFYGLGSMEQLTTLYNPMTLATVFVALVLIALGWVEATNMPRLNRLSYAVALGGLTALCLIRLGTASEFIYIQF